MILTWDIHAENGRIDEGGGVWTATNPTFSTDLGATNTAFVPNSTARFGYGWGAGGEIDLQTAISLTALDIEGAGYVFVGTALQVGQPGLIIDVKAAGGTRIETGFRGDGTVRKAGAYTLHLTGAPDHRGDFVIAEGHVVQSGGMTSRLSIAAGAALSTFGTLTEKVILGGALSQGLGGLMAGGLKIDGSAAVSLAGTVTHDTSAVAITGGESGQFLTLSGTVEGEIWLRHGPDRIEASGSMTHLHLGSGNDHALLTGIVHGKVTGHNGNDRILLRDTAQISGPVTGGRGHDLLDASGATYGAYLRGNRGNDTILGSDGNDRLTGDDGNDVLIAGLGADTMTGGKLTDTLDGDAGADQFVYRRIEEAPVAAKTETILGFEPGEDRIFLARIDAETDTPGNQSFRFIAQATFTQSAGELRAVQDATGLWLMGDVDGDGVADMVIYCPDLEDIAASDLVL